MKFVKFAFVVLVAAVILIAASSYVLFRSMNSPHLHDKANQFVKIEKGTPPREIIRKLAAEGILPGEYTALVYLRILGDASKLQAGDYQFQSPISPLQVLKELEKGEALTTKITIPEGFTRFDIAKRIVEKFPQNPPVDDKAVLSLMDDVTLKDGYSKKP